MLLQNKTAVIYGAGGAIGGAVARAFGKEGAKVFLAGRTLSSLEVVARDILQSGGAAEIAEVDAMDEQSVINHAHTIIKMAGSIDISFNAINYGDIHGKALVEMSQESFALPVINAMATQFYTTTVAARYMAKKGSGVILAITAQAGQQPHPNVGGWGVTCAAIESFCRQLSAELGPLGIRVVCLRSAGSPDAPGVDKVFQEHAKKEGISREAFETKLAESTLLKRLPRISEIANAAVIIASDRASAITGAITNLTCGQVVD